MNNPNFMFEGVNILKSVREATTDDLLQVAYRLAEANPALFCRLLKSNPTIVFTTGNVEVRVVKADIDYLRGLDSNDKVRAIKWMGETYGIGLKEAKDLSEWLVNAGYLPHKNWVAGYMPGYPPTSLGDILNEQFNHTNK